MHHVRLLTLSALMAAAGVPSVAVAQLSLPSTGAQTLSLKPDLVALIDRSTVQLKFTVVNMRANPGDLVMTPFPTVALTECNGLEVGQSRAVTVPPLRWGVRAASFKTSNGTEVRGPAAQILVRLTYKTVDGNGLVAEQVVNENVATLTPGAERFFSFTNPSRPTTYTIRKFKEPAKTQTTTSSARIGSPIPTAPRLFCIPSIATIDHAVAVTVDPDSRISDVDRTNNLLRVP